MHRKLLFRGSAKLGRKRRTRLLQILSKGKGRINASCGAEDVLDQAQKKYILPLAFVSCKLIFFIIESKILYKPKKTIAPIILYNVKYKNTYFNWNLCPNWNFYRLGLLSAHRTVVTVLLTEKEN